MGRLLLGLILWGIAGVLLAYGINWLVSAGLISLTMLVIYAIAQAEEHILHRIDRLEMDLHS